jgi:outer membrane immunogenic protein
MKRTLLAAATGLGAAALLAPAASAQVYAGAGATIFQADVDGEDVNLGAILGRAGFKTNPFFGFEGEFAIGIQDDEFDVLGQEVSVGLDSEYGVFAVGWLPIPLVGDLFGRVGYADLSVEAELNGTPVGDADGSGLAYGGGFQFSQIPFTQLRLEYTRYEADDAEIDSLGLSALLQF